MESLDECPLSLIEILIRHVQLIVKDYVKRTSSPPLTCVREMMLEILLGSAICIIWNCNIIFLMGVLAVLSDYSLPAHHALNSGCR